MAAGLGAYSTPVRPAVSKVAERLDLPVAISWHKGGRDITLGKLIVLDGSIAFATAYKWRVLPAMVSVPEQLAGVLVRLGVACWYVRDDLGRRMWAIDLRHLLCHGRRRGGEVYVRLDGARRVPWREWEYAKEVITVEELAAVAGCPRHLRFDTTGGSA